MEKELKLSILDKERKELLPLLKGFKNEFYLARGTALALNMGHRKSDDFDFFSFDHFKIKALRAAYRDYVDLYFLLKNTILKKSFHFVKKNIQDLKNPYTSKPC